MPGKSRRGRRGKYAFQSKRQGGSSRPNTFVQPQAAEVQAQQPTAISSASSPPRVVSAPQSRRLTEMVRPSGLRYDLVPTEIRTIAILAGLILILLVVLARVLA